MGFEPTLLCRTSVGHSNTAGATSHVVLRTPLIVYILERVKGVEPSSSTWKEVALAVELHPHETFQALLRTELYFNLAPKNCPVLFASFLLVPPPGLGPEPSDFQSDVHTCYTKEASCLVIHTGFEPVCSP